MLYTMYSLQRMEFFKYLFDKLYFRYEKLAGYFSLILLNST